jgi:hypothetical protein
VNAAPCNFESPDTPGVANFGTDCWNQCGGQQGKCSFCGTGMCCRKGWHDTGNGCDGSLGVQGRGHVCVPQPTGAPRPVWMASLLGTSSHWSLVGINSFRDANEKGFHAQLVPVAGSVTPQSAASYEYKLQWCGVGKEKSGPPPPPVPPPGAPPPPPGSAPPPPPPATTTMMPPASANLFAKNDPAKSLLNMECSKWRDQRGSKNFAWQAKTMAKCMDQDCAQSLEEDNGCRFHDSNRLCYAYSSAQVWCAGNPTNKWCHDQGADWAQKAHGIGTAADAAGTKWEPKQDVEVANPKAGDPEKYNCACYKDCTCKFKHGSSGKCYCTDDANPVLVGDKNEVIMRKKGKPDTTLRFIKKNKNGHCACVCHMHSASG